MLKKGTLIMVLVLQFVVVSSCGTEISGGLKAANIQNDTKNIKSVEATNQGSLQKSTPVPVTSPLPGGRVWERVADMPTGRMECSVVALNGRLYAIGGGTGNPWVGLNKTEVYDSAKNKWEKKLDAPEEICRAVAVNSKIYAVAGNIMYEYDPIMDKWKEKSKILVPREQFSMAAVNGKIYLIGGKFYDGYIVEEYDVNTGKWVKKKNKGNPT